MAQEITITIPDESLSALEITPDKLSAEIRLIAAIKYYEMGRLSTGAAAVFAGIPKVLFLTKLGDYGVNTFKLTEAELIEDFANA